MTDNQLIDNSEVDFWLYYIQHWQQNHSEAVPERAYQALEYARSNLMHAEVLAGVEKSTEDTEPTIH